MRGLAPGQKNKTESLETSLQIAECYLTNKKQFEIFHLTRPDLADYSSQLAWRQTRTGTHFATPPIRKVTRYHIPCGSFRSICACSLRLQLHERSINMHRSTRYCPGQRAYMCHRDFFESEASQNTSQYAFDATQASLSCQPSQVKLNEKSQLEFSNTQCKSPQSVKC